MKPKGEHRKTYEKHGRQEEGMRKVKESIAKASKNIGNAWVARMKSYDSIRNT